MRIQNKLLTGLLLLTGCILCSISVLAFWKAVDIAHNVLTLGSFDTELAEEYYPPGSVYPGMSVDKKVNVKNSGTVDAIIRIRLEKAFGTRASDGTFLPERLLDESLIQIKYNEEFWKQKDGYWYYTEILKAGEETKEALFDSFSISEQADNQYKGKEAEILVYMDSIQAEGDALSLWDTSAEELHIYYEPELISQETAVIFHGREKGFSFSGTESDLFANFKNLVPGGTRSQNIQLKNKSDETIHLYLYAEITEQDRMHENDRKMLERILEHDAQIQICSNENILYQGPVNGNPSLKDNSMGEQARIFLGKYSPNTEQELQVDLSLSPELNHSCEQLTGRVNWIFCAEGEDSEKSEAVIGYVPKTGDSTPWGITAGISLLSFLLLCLLVINIRYRKRKLRRKCCENACEAYYT